MDKNSWGTSAWSDPSFERTSAVVLATQAGVVPNSRVIGVDAGVSGPIKLDVAAIGELES